MSSATTYVDMVLAGTALADEIDDFVDKWADSEADLGSLHDFLGLTPSEYRLWVEHPESLRFIFAARKSGRSPGEVQEIAGAAAAAARAADDGEAASVLAWLRKTGRYSEGASS